MDHDELRRLAEAATPGPWRQVYGGVCGQAHPELGDEQGYERPVCNIRCGSVLGDDMAYIAAAHPGTVLALLDEAAVSRRQLEVIEAICVREQCSGETIAEAVDDMASALAAANERIAALEAEVERLRGDLGMGRYCPTCESWMNNPAPDRSTVCLTCMRDGVVLRPLTELTALYHRTQAALDRFQGVAGEQAIRAEAAESALTALRETLDVLYERGILPGPARNEIRRALGGDTGDECPTSD